MSEQREKKEAAREAGGQTKLSGKNKKKAPQGEAKPKNFCEQIKKHQASKGMRK